MDTDVELIPAIDLLGGRVVRLSKGAYDAVTEYGDDPVAVARSFEADGAERIHIVDLDAAREGRVMQAEVIAHIVAAVDVPCQVAGGIRDADAVAAGGLVDDDDAMRRLGQGRRVDRRTRNLIPPDALVQARSESRSSRWRATSAHEPSGSSCR